MAANFLPLLLLGGAAFALSSGKKKRKKSTSSSTHEPLPYSPPPLTKKQKSSGSGYSNVSRARMQWIQTALLTLGYDVGPDGVDGRFGRNTKAAVRAFQEDHSDLENDGLPGKLTQAKLEKVLSAHEQERAQAQAQNPSVPIQHECDPLDPGTWGSGNICSMVEGRWVRVPEHLAQPAQAQPQSPKTSFTPGIDLANDKVTTINGYSYNLAAWSIPNMEVCVPATVSGRYSAEKNCTGQDGVDLLTRKLEAWDGEPYVIDLQIDAWLKDGSDFMAIAEAFRAVAMGYPNVLFVLRKTRPSFFGDNFKEYDLPYAIMTIWKIGDLEDMARYHETGQLNTTFGKPYPMDVDNKGKPTVFKPPVRLNDWSLGEYREKNISVINSWVAHLLVGAGVL